VLACLAPLDGGMLPSITFSPPVSAVVEASRCVPLSPSALMKPSTRWSCPLIQLVQFGRLFHQLYANGFKFVGRRRMRTIASEANATLRLFS